MGCLTGFIGSELGKQNLTGIIPGINTQRALYMCVYIYCSLGVLHPKCPPNSLGAQIKQYSAGVDV